MGFTVFGVRHHGPGCARSLRRALDELRPDIVVMEGPPDAGEILSWAAHGAMKPPVALLVYPPQEPRRAVYFPLAVFSPEWQTLDWAAANKVPVRLMDLPQSHQIAMETAEQTETSTVTEPDGPADGDTDSEPSAAAEAPAVDFSPAEPTSATRPAWQSDPLAILAEAAGYKDHELWWEDQIERRADATGLFAGIHQAMASVRSEMPEVKARDLVREAFMRKTLRAVAKEGFQNVAVVCGAWHAPVLDADAIAGKLAGCKIKDDNERLSGLPKVKTTATWIPWTFSRLTYRSGYGAGIQSPGWYEHLWQSNDEAPTRWLTAAARLLRGRDLDASSASVIEARRLADALAAIREIRAPGLAELTEAILTVLCHGEPAPLRLIRTTLEIGDVVGEVPPEIPSVPLQQDLIRQQSSLRLKPSTEIRRVDLDLRKENDLARSQLFHRLCVLDIPWGRHEQSGGKTSTFHEVWTVEWKPDFAVAVIEANIWGTTIEAAATGKIVHDAQAGSDLAAITSLLEISILAGLDSAVDPLLSRIQSMAALGSDVRHLMDALPPLARVARYGDVRGTKAAHVEPILQGIFERAVVGIAAACSALDDDAARRVVESMGGVNQALQILNRADLQTEWRECLDRLIKKGVHPLVCGWCCRLLLEARAITPDELYRLARVALSPANAPAECAAWATGLLHGSGMVLLHQDALWEVFDRWLSELSAEVFVEMLPLLRRAFCDFTQPERRQMGEKVKKLGSLSDITVPARTSDLVSDRVDPVRASRVLPILKHILGP
jgi:hypothetical protein